MDLKQHWLYALEAAATAVDAAARIHALRADEGRARLDRLRGERAWVETFDWRTV